MHLLIHTFFYFLANINNFIKKLYKPDMEKIKQKRIR